MVNKVYKEGSSSTATHNGKEYSLDVLFKRTHGRVPIDIKVSKLSWVLEYAEVDEDRVNAADVNVPLLVYDDQKYGLTAIDGAHRLTKATRLHLDTVPAIILTDEDMASAVIDNNRIAMLSDSNKTKTWDPRFAPSYTPEEMLKLGVFEGKYINNIKGIPASWKKIPKVLGPDDEPDPKINKYGVKSRQGLSVWKKNGWIKTDGNGWAQWFFLYYLGRRLGEEDNWQIGRWRSFVARHMGQLKADPKSKQEDKWLKSKQGLLQWAYNWEHSVTDEQFEKNAKRIAKLAGVPLAEVDEKDKKKVAQESLIIVPKYSIW